MRLAYGKLRDNLVLFSLIYIIIFSYFFPISLYIVEPIMIVFLLLVLLLIGFQYKIKFYITNALWMLSTVVSCLSIIYSIDQHSSFQYCVLLIFFNVLCLVCIQEKMNWYKIINCLLLFCGFHMIVTMVQLFLPNVFYSVVSRFLSAETLVYNRQFWTHGTYCGLHENPAPNGFLISVFVLCIFDKLLTEKKSNKRVMDIILLVFGCLALIMTQKRSFLIFVAVIILASWIIGFRKSERKIRFIVISVMMLFIIFYFVYRYEIDELITKKMIRYIQSGDVSNGRIDLWRESLNFFKLHPLVGNGIHTVYTVLRNDSHNIYIQLLAEVGIFGAVFFYASLICPLVPCFKYIVKNKILSGDIFIVFSIQVLFLLYGITANPLFDHKFMWIYSVIVGMSGGIVREKNRNINIS